MIASIPFLRITILLLGVSLLGVADTRAEPGRVNLLVNAAFNFHAFENSRKGESTAGKSGAVLGWD
ncbi:MAG: hypothetical protein RIQ93_1634 [Verrucomicrobiota bacterium]|jgi:hypothetical protein